MEKFSLLKLLILVPGLINYIKESEKYQTEIIELLKRDLSKFEHRCIAIFLMSLFLQYDLTGIWEENNDQSENNQVACLVRDFVRSWDNFTIFCMIDKIFGF